MSRTEHEGQQRGSAFDVQRTHPLGRVELVTRHREQIDVQLTHVHADLAERLRRVGVSEGPHGVGEPRQLFHGLDHAGLVVRVHPGHQRRVRAHGLRGFIDAGATLGIDTDAADPPPVLLQPVAGASGRRVFDQRGDDVAAVVTSVGHAADREVVRLGTAGSEDHFVGLAADQRRHLLPSPSHGLARALPVDVTARRVAEVIAKIGQHRVHDLGQDGRGRVVVEVDRVGVVHGQRAGAHATGEERGTTQKLSGRAQLVPVKRRKAPRPRR